MCGAAADSPEALLDLQDIQLLRHKLKTAEAALDEERVLNLREREVIIERLRFAQVQDEALSLLREQHSEQRAGLVIHVAHLGAQVEQLQAALWSCECRARSAAQEAQLAFGAEADAKADQARLHSALRQREEEYTAAISARQDMAAALQRHEFNQEMRLDEARVEVGCSHEERQRLVSEVHELRARCNETQHEAAELETSLEAECRSWNSMHGDLELRARREQRLEDRLAGAAEAEGGRDRRAAALGAELAELRSERARARPELPEPDREVLRWEGLASAARSGEEAALAELAESEERRREGLRCMDELLRDARDLDVSLSQHRHLTKDLRAPPERALEISKGSAQGLTQSWTKSMDDGRPSGDSHYRIGRHMEDAWEASEISVSAAQRSAAGEEPGAWPEDSGRGACSSTREGSSRWASPPRGSAARSVHSSLSFSPTWSVMRGDSRAGWAESSRSFREAGAASLSNGRPAPFEAGRRAAP